MSYLPKSLVVYLSGKYSAHTPEDITANIAAARKVAIELIEAGYYVLCPHLNTAHMEVDCQASYDHYLTMDIALLSRCDAIVMLPDWKRSKGAKAEYCFAIEAGIPAYIYPERPDVPVTVTLRPIQCIGFRQIIEKMYRIHLSKNSDYSPSNIIGCGEIGIVTRTWDKIARLLNLTGFQLELSDPKFIPKMSFDLKLVWKMFKNLRTVMQKTGFHFRINSIKWGQPKSPKHESILDTVRDNAVYSIIYELFTKGQWGV